MGDLFVEQPTVFHVFGKRHASLVAMRYNCIKPQNVATSYTLSLWKVIRSGDRKRT
jgi:hypothetical protein